VESTDRRNTAEAREEPTITPPKPGLSIALHELLVVCQLVGAPLVGVVFIYVRDISKRLRAMDERIIALETSIRERKEFVDARFESTERELDQIQDRYKEAVRMHIPRHSGMEDQ